MSRINRRCHRCGTLLTTTRGVKQHQNYCFPNKYSRTSVKKIDLTIKSTHHRRKDAQQSRPTLKKRAEYEDHNSGIEITPEAWGETELPPEGIVDIDSLESRFSPNLDPSGGNGQLPLDLAQVAGPRSLSSSTISRVETYEESTGRSAGRPLSESDVQRILAADNRIKPPTNYSPSRDGEDDKNRPSYYPFASETEYAQVSWWLRNGTSWSEVDAWLKDPRMRFMTAGFFSCRNAAEVRAKLQANPYNKDIPQWQTTVVVACGGDFKVHHRDVEDVISFLMGHIPFDGSMVYAPIQQFSDAGLLMLDDLYTASWWWDTQNELPEGATLIPIILASDKTQLTNHAGDKVAWPVYMTIGNIKLQARRARGRPAMPPLAWIPQDLPKDRTKRLTALHAILDAVLSPLEELSKRGMLLRCADGKIRHCFPVLAIYIADYEEQTMLTGVKPTQHCTICEVPPGRRSELMSTVRGEFKYRTHAATQDRLKKQREFGTSPDDPEYIREVNNFAWRHRMCNIHLMMAPDLLHQVCKGMTEHLLGWLVEYLQSEAGELKKRYGIQGSAKSVASNLLDQRFAQVELFTDMARFKRFSETNQWTGKMYKSLIRQLVPVMEPLLRKERGTMLFVRAFVDFAILSMYSSHDGETIRYLTEAIYRMDKSKDVFLQFRPQAQSKPNFNFPKFHAISHYPAFISKFGALENSDSNISEQGHIQQKCFYRRTNKRGNYIEQMLQLNTNNLNSTVRDELGFWADTEAVSTADERDQTQSIRLASAINLVTTDTYKWSVDAETINWLGRRNINPNYWRTASEVQSRLQITDFLDKLAPFVRERRKRQTGKRSTNYEVERLEVDNSWVSDMPVSIHHSIACYVSLGKDGADTSKHTKMFARCAPAWGDDKSPRRDSVLVQEFEDSRDVLNGLRPARLRLLFSVQDTQRIDESGKYEVYRGALVEQLTLSQGGKVDELHGMVRVDEKHTPKGKAQRVVGTNRIYDVSEVRRPIQLVPVDIGQTGSFWINNYTDFEIYNKIYDSDFIQTNRTHVDRFERQQRPRTAQILKEWNG